jgi:hypothetical protein
LQANALFRPAKAGEPAKIKYQKSKLRNPPKADDLLNFDICILRVGSGQVLIFDLALILV